MVMGELMPVQLHNAGTVPAVPESGGLPGPCCLYEAGWITTQGRLGALGKFFL
jgi:hypothetical protein